MSRGPTAELGVIGAPVQLALALLQSVIIVFRRPATV